MISRATLVAVWCSITVTVSVPAQQPAGSQPPPAANSPCAAPEFRQFDFWIGEWEVRTPDGRVAGTNSIRTILNGCVIEETWTGTRGMTGRSLNTFDPGSRKWYQTWVDDSGGFLLLSGEFTHGVMQLAGEMPASDTGTVLHRLSFSRVAGSPDQIRQVWERSSDGGKTWARVFEGVYLPRKEPRSRGGSRATPARPSRTPPSRS